MSFKAAAILSAVVIVAMFILPGVVVSTIIPPLLQQNLPVPLYDRLLIGFAEFCETWRFLLILPIIAGLFTTAVFTSKLSGAKK